MVATTNTLACSGQTSLPKAQAFMGLVKFSLSLVAGLGRWPIPGLLSAAPGQIGGILDEQPCASAKLLRKRHDQCRAQPSHRHARVLEQGFGRSDRLHPERIGPDERQARNRDLRKHRSKRLLGKQLDLAAV